MTSKMIILAHIEEYEDAIATAFPKCTCDTGSCFHCYYVNKLKKLNKELDKDD